MAVRIKDIAIECGVSEGTVDRALNGRGGICKETKDKILAVAKRMNYEPNHLASCLAKGSSKTIGVLCADIKNPFFSSLIEEIEQTAHENGYFINLILTHNSVERELEGIRYLVGRQTDGIIMFPIGIGKEYEAELDKVKVPIVTIYNRISDRYVHIGVDCKRIMKDAVAFIASKGYKNIMYLDPRANKDGIVRNSFSLDERRKGYVEGVKTLSAEKSSIDIKPEIITISDYDRIVSKLKNEREKTAILCAFDRLAIAILERLKKDGLKVPEDVGIMGFDNTTILDLISPRLYSVDCGTKELGREAFKILIKIIKGDETVGDCITDYMITYGESL